MKKYIIALGLAFGIIGCSDDYYDQLNIDHSNPSDVPASFLVTYATKSLADQMSSINVNLNIFNFISQYYTATTYLDEPNYDLNNRNIPGNHWNRLYTRVLYNLKDAKEKVTANTKLTPEVKANQLAVIEILEVYTWQVLVDTFGNVPYTEALQGSVNMYPVYDDAAAIYSDLLTRINHSIQTIDVNEPGFGDDDNIYGDNMSAWKAAAASLKLKMGVQLLDVNPSVATTAINSAYNDGLISSNDDNFMLQYLSASPNINPHYSDLVLSGRSDYVAANTIVDYMNDLNDPRRVAYFDDNLGAGVYSGGIYGASNPFSAYTHLGARQYSPTMPGVLIDYAEVEFLLAEAAVKGITLGGDAASHYEAGIRANMAYWGIPTVNIDAYLAQSSVNWATAPGSAKEKLAKQFWLAMYSRGFEGWNVWRRLDAPQLNIAAFSGNPIPTRYTYPLSESSLNPANYGQAASAIGGDTQTTKLFWDVH